MPPVQIVMSHQNAFAIGLALRTTFDITTSTPGLPLWGACRGRPFRYTRPQASRSCLNCAPEATEAGQRLTLLARRGERNGTALECRSTNVSDIDTLDLMTSDDTDPGAGAEVAEGREPTAAEVAEWERQRAFAAEDRTGPDDYPRMVNLSAAWAYRGVIRATDPAPAEYVTLPWTCGIGELALTGQVGMWNMLWEAAQYRRRFFDEDDLPPEVAAIADSGDVNVVFVPRTEARYYEYAPMFHLLPAATAARFGLPLLAAGQWPFMGRLADMDEHLPADFAARLGKAWAATVWRHLSPGSGQAAFTQDDPIRLLAHNLDFWLPAVTATVQDRLRDLPEVDSGIDPAPVQLEDGSLLPGAVLANPRNGGDIWCGEQEAAWAVADVVEAADATGRLRGILDAVRSNRVVDDFSDRWSYAKEDFERKLYRKRAKVKVRFVELTDTIPVQGPDTEVEHAVVYADFLALLNPRDREVVVLLNSGVTKLTEVASILGYANHSAVSKRLARIRDQAARFFDTN